MSITFAQQANVPTIINTAVYTGGHLNLKNYNSGWGMPIPMQVSHIREDGTNPNLVHVTNTDFGFGHSYTYNTIGSQITFENSNQTTFGFSSSQYIRPLSNEQLSNDQKNNTIFK